LFPAYQRYYKRVLEEFLDQDGRTCLWAGLLLSLRVTQQQQDYWEWYRVNDGQFRGYFYDDAKALQKDLAVVNIKDRRLDELIERHERYFLDRNRQPPKTVVDNSMMFHLSIDNIEEIGQRFKFLATQIPR
jgi:hypothetical protein